MRTAFLRRKRARDLATGGAGIFAVAGMIALAGCGDLLQEPDTGIGPAALTVEAISGGGQSGTPGAPLTAPLRVRLIDRHGRPVPRLRVEWTPLAGSGEAEPRNAFSDANGIAETTWILGPGTGPQELRAVIGGGLPTAFVATAVGL